MSATVETPRPQKRQKPARKASYHAINDRFGCLEITTGEGEKAETKGYYVEQVASDFGLAFHLSKYRIHRVDGEETDYDVLLDMTPDDPEHPRHQCGCLGHLRWGHKTLCRHIGSLLALFHAGKLACKPTT